MYFCAELDAGGQCLRFEPYMSIFNLPLEAGVKIGSALLLCCLAAWGCRQVASLILNR